MNRNTVFGLLLVFILPGFRAAASPARLVETTDGWRMEVAGKPFYVKGFTWSHTPVGMKYDYDLFEEEDDVIRAALERDMTLMKAAGANTVRNVVPLRWMKHLHESYGMHFISNDHCGRYGLEVGGRFVNKPNYADPATREVIKENWRSIATEYRGAPGLIAHALGNENNYGLEWKSAEIENLPEGERHRAKARHLYTLFNEVALEIRKIDPDHPVGIVNGDLQYLDLIAELCPDIDFLGVNAYRGETYSDLFEQVAAKLGKPVLLVETGCDAYHAHEGREDQLSQARIIHCNWVDLYRNTAANGGHGNCIGALVFEWADEWWKKGQQVNLAVHDTAGSWHHAAYTHDAAAAQNMNEEWFGVCSIRPEAIDGAHLIQPRAAYFALKELWQHDPYTLGKAALGKLELDQTAVTAKAREAAGAVAQLLPNAEIPYRKPKKLELPATVYREANDKPNWHPSGVMPEKNFIALDPACTTRPHAGSTCLKVDYRSGGDWSGVIWQHPALDWENNSPGGFDLGGATKLSFWARGEKGGEKLKVAMGGPLTGIYPNTCSADLGELVLEADWKQYTLPLDGKDLRRIKNPFTITLTGNGFPFRLYLDDVLFK